MPRDDYNAEEEAFLNQNGWAAQANDLLQCKRDGDPAYEAFAAAMLAGAYETWMSTHRVETAIRDHAQETRTS